MYYGVSRGAGTSNIKLCGALLTRSPDCAVTEMSGPILVIVPRSGCPGLGLRMRTRSPSVKGRGALRGGGFGCTGRVRVWRLLGLIRKVRSLSIK